MKEKILSNAIILKKIYLNITTWIFILFQELDETEKSFQELEDKENEDGLYSVLYILFYSRDFFRTFYLKLVFVYLTYLLLFIYLFFFVVDRKRRKTMLALYIVDVSLLKSFPRRERGSYFFHFNSNLEMNIID